MKTINLLLASSCLSLLAFTASTQAAPNPNTVYFQAPAIAGNGCPSGTTDYTLTPDGRTLSILFDSYIVESGNKKCDLAIPVHVPNGYQVSLMTADYRGFIEGRGEIRRNYFFAGQSGFSKKNKFNKPNGDDYYVKDNLLLSSGTFSPCGKDVILRAKTRIRTLNSNSYMSLDSADMKMGATYHLQFQQC